ncbi:preprotein translocase subunit YajC, partial [Mammaliicoccus sciuri]
MEVLVQLLPIILIFALVWFLMIRPQQKRAKEHRELLNRLEVGQKVTS